jgi:hypothetical protein
VDKNILLSKIVANPTDTTWAQAYSTLNLYVVLSVRAEDSEGGIVSRGKELLERIQREYFSLDNKSLANIKRSVDNSLEGSDRNSTSVVLATIHEDELFIIIAGTGEVVLKRNGKIGSVARGEQGEVTAFLGKIQGDDVIVLGTGDFSAKIPIEKLAKILDGLDVSEISESLAPQVHESASGGEAAIILQYKSVESSVPELKEDESIEELGHEERPKIPAAWQDIARLAVMRAFGGKILGWFRSGIKISNFGKKHVIITAIVLLMLVLLGSIFFERNRQESNKRQQVLSEILTSAQKRYDEGLALVGLDKGLAYKELDSLKITLEKERDKFAKETAERKKLDEFIGKVESKIGELGAGETIANQKMLIENVSYVSYREGLIAVDESGKIYILSRDGRVTREFDSKNGNVSSVISDERHVYILGDNGITRTTKSNGATITIIEEPRPTVEIDNFGANIYGLNARDKTIDKYVGGRRSDYFVENIALNDPKSMSINASIWVIDGKKIRKFTRGREDNFSVRGLTGDLSNNAKIFTAPGYSNIYILDPGNARIVSIKKDGEFEKQYSWKDFASATSLSVDEDGETIYVVINNKLYSFDL